MKKIIKVLFICIVLMVTISFIKEVSAATVKISKTKISLAVGQKKQLKIKNNKGKVKWKSKNKKIATVSAGGVVKAKKVGKTKVIAKVSNKKLYCTINVKKQIKPDYSRVLNQYRKAIKNNYYSDVFNGLSDDFDVIGKYLNDELLSSSRYYDEFHIYYTLKDLNGDGIKELLVNAAEDKEHISNYIYDVFTFKKGKPVRLFEKDFVFGYRMELRINSKNVFCIDSSGGASVHGKYYYKLKEDSTKTKLLTKLEYDYGDYYMVNSRGNKTKITENKYNSIKNRYEKKIKSFKWKKLG